MRRVISALAHKKMKKRKWFWLLAGTILVIGTGVYLVRSSGTVNDLGLSGSDVRMGGDLDLEILRRKTKAVADAYLAQHDSVFADICKESYTLSVDYSLTPRVISLGYKSSFYYHCWDIYLPYSLKSESGEVYVVAVQTSDSTSEYTHDPNKFHVIRAIVLGHDGSVKKCIE